MINRCCIESFLNSVIEGNLDYKENINPGYNTLAIYASLQTAIQSFIDKFISVSVIFDYHIASYNKLSRDFYEDGR